MKKMITLFGIVMILTLGNEMTAPLIVSANFEGYQNSCLTSSSSGDDSISDGDVDTNGATGDWTKKGTKNYKNALEVFNRLTKDLEISGAAVSGVMGNIAQESRFTVDIDNGSGDGGHGLIQWTGGRRTELENFAKKEGKDPNSLELQIDMIEHDMKRPEMWVSGKWHDNSLKKFAQMDDPEEAASRFYISQMEAGGGNTSDPDGTEPKRKEYAKQAYVTFGGADIPPGSAVGGASDTVSDGGSTSDVSDPCKQVSSDDLGSNGDIVKTAKELEGYFTYEQVHGESNIGSIEHPDKNGKTDCSGFVWLALAKAGYKVPDNMGWFTKSMETDAKGAHKWLKEVDPKDAKAGDVVIVNTGGGAGSNGHTGILAENWKDQPEKNNSTKIIQEGGRSMGGVNIDEFKYSFTSLLTGDHTITFARAIKK